MKNVYIFLLILIIPLLSNCAGIRSSINYTKGTECLEKGDFEGARSYLEEACRLDPSMSRNHNNLACTYLELDEIDKAWYSARQAAFLDPTNKAAVITFTSLFCNLK